MFGSRIIQGFYTMVNRWVPPGVPRGIDIESVLRFFMRANSSTRTKSISTKTMIVKFFPSFDPSLVRPPACRDTLLAVSTDF